MVRRVGVEPTESEDDGFTVHPTPLVVYQRMDKFAL